MKASVIRRHFYDTSRRALHEDWFLLNDAYLNQFKLYNPHGMGRGANNTPTNSTSRSYHPRLLCSPGPTRVLKLLRLKVFLQTLCSKYALRGELGCESIKMEYFRDVLLYAILVSFTNLECVRVWYCYKRVFK